MKLRITILMFIIISSLFVKGQDKLSNFKYLGKNYDDGLFIGLAIGQSNLSNNEAPNPQNHRVSGLSSNIDMRRLRLGKGQANMRFENKQLGDLISLLFAVNKNSNAIYRTESTPLSCGLIGWWNWTWNFNEASDFVVSGGMNFHDYFYGSYYKDDTTGNSFGFSTFEPQGYYFAAGPSISAQYAPTSFFIVESTSSYSFSFWRPVSISNAKVDKDYPKPHWIQFNLGLITKWGVFTQVSYNKIINRGYIPNNGKRLDFLIGFRFIKN